MESCIFCRIIEGSLPANKIFENRETIAFLDIGPVHPGHSLVIPRKHFKDIFDCDENIMGEVMKTAKKISGPIMKAVKADGINIGMNNKESAGQEVFHAHVHVIPRYREDGLRHWKKEDFRDENHRKEVHENIMKELS